MKKCPFCAEEIQDDAIKCKHCGEWLRTINNIKTSSPLAVSSVETHQTESWVKKKTGNTSLALKEISSAKMITLAMLFPAVIILLDFFISMTLFGLSQKFDMTDWRVIAYPLYFSLGIWLADYIYRLKKATLIIAISFFILFIYRFLIAAIYKPEFLGQTMANTLEESLIVYVPLSLSIFLFRHFEQKFGFAVIKNKFESTDPITKKKYDSGTCSKCGEITIIGRERFISFLGKSSEYFCGNCNRFIMGNPLNNIFLGITESVVSFLFLLIIGVYASKMGGKSSSYSGILSVLFLVGIYDGIKRTVSGHIGVKRSNSSEVQPILSEIQMLNNITTAVGKKTTANKSDTSDSGSMDANIEMANQGALKEDIRKMSSEIFTALGKTINEIKKISPLNKEQIGILYNILMPFFIHLHDRIMVSRFGDKTRTIYIEYIVDAFYHNIYLYTFKKKTTINFDEFKSLLNNYQSLFSQYKEITTASNDMQHSLIWQTARHILDKLSLQNDSAAVMHLYRFLTISFENFSVHKINCVV